MIVSTSSCVFTPVLHDFPSLQWHFCGSRSPGSQHYYDWWVIEPGREWVNILCHYWKEICVCPDSSSIFYRKIPVYRIASLGLASAMFPCCWLDWGHIAVVISDNPHLYIALSFWFDQLNIILCLGICVSWSSSQIWVVPFGVVFTPVCFVFSSRWIAVSFSYSMDWSIGLHQPSVCASKLVGTNHFFQVDMLSWRSCYHKHPSKEWSCCLQRQIFSPSHSGHYYYV